MARTFRLGEQMIDIESCTPLYRGSSTLVLTQDERFALVGPRSSNSKGAARELTAAEARDFLIAHGEHDLVEEFPDLFRKPATAPTTRPQEPYLFPLH
jgi:hypothetical protein